MERTVEILLSAAGIYSALGGLAAIAFHARGLARIDPASVGAPWTFRLLVTPGLIALWPIILGRWLRSAPPPDPARPVRPRGLRTGQAIVVRVVAVVVAVAGTLAIVSRPAAPSAPGPPGADAAAVMSALDPAPYPEVLRTIEAPFGELPIEARLRAGPGGARQLELAVARDLLIPTLALYWVPGARGEPIAGPGEGAVFLGTVWGPGTRRIALPSTIAGDGSLLLHSIARAETVAVAAVSLGEAPR